MLRLNRINAVPTLLGNHKPRTLFVKREDTSRLYHYSLPAFAKTGRFFSIQATKDKETATVQFGFTLHKTGQGPTPRLQSPMDLWNSQFRWIENPRLRSGKSLGVCHNDEAALKMIKSQREDPFVEADVHLESLSSASELGEYIAYFKAIGLDLTPQNLIILLKNHLSSALIYMDAFDQFYLQQVEQSHSPQPISSAPVFDFFCSALNLVNVVDASFECLTDLVSDEVVDHTVDTWLALRRIYEYRQVQSGDWSEYTILVNLLHTLMRDDQAVDALQDVFGRKFLNDHDIHPTNIIELADHIMDFQPAYREAFFKYLCRFMPLRAGDIAALYQGAFKAPLNVSNEQVTLIERVRTKIQSRLLSMGISEPQFYQYAANCVADTWDDGISKSDSSHLSALRILLADMFPEFDFRMAFLNPNNQQAEQKADEFIDFILSDSFYTVVSVNQQAVAFA